ncbi:MAG: carboxypeptidase-like regulatory domain-containing protein [Gilvibacter sp.]
MNALRLMAVVLLMTSTLSYSQTSSKKVALVYDTSYGMRTKDLAKELAFLDSYFNQNPDVTLYLKTFSNTIIFEANYSIQNGNWSNLKQELSNTIYDGASNFDNILPTNVDEILLVTDGLSSRDNLPKEFAIPVNVISSTPKVNDNQLRDLCLGSGGVFINVTNMTLAAQSAEKIITVSGTVRSSLGPLPQVAIYSPETKSSEITDANGEYSIVAQRGGRLEFSYIGKKTVSTEVPLSGIKNIRLSDGSEVLDEVVLTAAGEVEEEELVNTGNQLIDKKRLGYGIETISGDDITEQDINLETAIRGQFSNIILESNQSNLKEFLSRGRNMSILLDQTGLIVIDGVPVDSSPYAGDNFDVSEGLPAPRDTPVASDAVGGTGVGTEFAGLDPNNIDSITVLKGLAATNKYGTLGRNGVILINTKNGLGYRGDQNNDIPLGTTATYDGKAAMASSLPETSYIKAMQQQTTIEGAYDEYLKQRETFGDDANFFINVAQYFKNWNNPYMLERILSNVNEVPASLEDLRALAYSYQELGLTQQSVAAYERIKNMNPSQAQVHRNLALAYVQNGQLDEALAIYKAFDANTIAQVSDFGTMRKTMVNEYKNLLALHKSTINTDGVNDFYMNNITYSTRVVFEWSDFDAKFDLQIVNPQQRYFTWSHTPQAEAVRMRQEQSLGYGLEEFFMTSSDTGEWLFNLTYFGKNGGDTAKPTYLKITTIHNFGKPNQREHVEVISLLDEGNTQTVLKLDLK